MLLPTICNGGRKKARFPGLNRNICFNSATTTAPSGMPSRMAASAEDSGLLVRDVDRASAFAFISISTSV